MPYSEPLQMPNGKWHFTTTRDGSTVAVGGCADGCPGHDTADGAREHYRDYIVARARFGVEMREQLKCRVCGERTYLAVTAIPRQLVPLCGDHHDETCLRPYVGHDHKQG